MIRPALPSDLPQLVALGLRFMNESHYGRLFTINHHAIRDLMTNLLGAEHGLLLVEDLDDEITGMIGVIATYHPTSGDPVMSELFWYVEPEARGAGVRLLKAAEDWGRSIGVRKSMVSSPNDRVSALYARLGYQPMERQFIKDL